MFEGIIGLIALVFAILVIYDVLANQKSFSNLQKVLWIVAAIIFSIITGVVYYFIYKW